MLKVVADAGPLHYLVLIRAIDLLPRLFGRVSIPEAVGVELSQPTTPSLVRDWLAANPEWLERLADPPALDRLPSRLGAGERAAIGSARALGDALLLIDDRTGVKAARTLGIEATGTLGVLMRAAQLGLIDLRTAFEQLSATNFRYRQEVLDELVSRYEANTM